jgi:hypothetical protein
MPRHRAAAQVCAILLFCCCAAAAHPNATAGEEDRFLVYLPFRYGGAGNNFLAVANALKVAKVYNRTLVLLPLTSWHVDREGGNPWILPVVSRQQGLLIVRPRWELLQAPELRFSTYLRVIYQGVRTREVQDFDPFPEELRCWDYARYDAHVPRHLNRTMAALEKKYSETLDDKFLCIGEAFFMQKIPSLKPTTKLFDISGAIKAVAKHWMAANGLVKGQYLAVHVRRGDNGPYSENLTCIMDNKCFATYGVVRRVVDLAKGLNNLSAVFVATNERNATNLAWMSSLGWRHMVDFESFLGYFPPLSDVRLQHHRHGMYQMLVDQCIATYSGAFVFSARSSFAQMVAGFRECSQLRPCHTLGHYLHNAPSGLQDSPFAAHQAAGNHSKTG